MTFDGKAFGAEIVGVVKGYLAKELAPLVSRLDGLEKRLAEIPQPRGGKDADPEQIVSTVTVKLDADLSTIRQAVDELGSRVPANVKSLVDEAVKSAMSSIPLPQDGRSVTIDDVAPLISSEVEKRVGALPKPKDGVDGKDGLEIKEMFRAEGGRLIVVMSDGTTRDLGVFVGKDGEPGRPGRDGFNLEDFDATVMEDGRTVLLSFTGKDIDYKVELGFPVMLYRGVFREGEYAKGDTVTWGGSLWHCDIEKTTEKPGEGSSAWTLCAKKGRDGKNGEVKEAKPFQPIPVGIPTKGK